MSQEVSPETLAAQALGEVDPVSGALSPAIHPSTMSGVALSAVARRVARVFGQETLAKRGVRRAAVGMDQGADLGGERLFGLRVQLKPGNGVLAGRDSHPAARRSAAWRYDPTCPSRRREDQHPVRHLVSRE